MKWKMLLGVVGAGAIVWSIMPNVVARGPQQGYDIRVLGVERNPRAAENASENAAKVRFEVSWPNRDFPGTRNCEWLIFDDSGRVIGRDYGTLTSMESTPDGIYRDMDVEPGAHIDRAQISCDSARLDDPSGSFSFTDIRIVRPASNAAADMDVFFTVSWAGNGTPTPQTCDIVVMDQSGNFLFKATHGFHSVGTEPVETNFSIEAPAAAKETVADAASAEISCSPIT